ncbi:MAG: hypothetical protein ABF246_01425 [Winogradskyella sp.]
MKKRHEQKLVLLSIATFFILNMPLIFIFESDDAIFGIPVLYFSIFSIWLISILVSYVILKRHYE